MLFYISHPQTQGGFITSADFGIIFSAYMNELCISMGEDGPWATTQKCKRPPAAYDTQDDDESGEGVGGCSGGAPAASNGSPGLSYGGQGVACLRPDQQLRGGIASNGRGGGIEASSAARKRHETLDGAFQAWLCVLSTFQPGVE